VGRRPRGGHELPLARRTVKLIRDGAPPAMPSPKKGFGMASCRSANRPDSDCCDEL
jgi:hypothetical protein